MNQGEDRRVRRLRAIPGSGLTQATVYDLTQRLQEQGRLKPITRQERYRRAALHVAPFVMISLTFFALGVWLHPWFRYDPGQPEAARLVERWRVGGSGPVVWRQGGGRLLRLSSLTGEGELPGISLEQERHAELWLLGVGSGRRSLEQDLALASTELARGDERSLRLGRQVLEQSLKVHGRLPRILGDIAVANLLLGNVEAGASLLEEALSQSPRDAVLLFNAVQLMNSQQWRFEESEHVLLQRFLQHEPSLQWRRDVELKYRKLIRELE
ncbi:MAG: hypothetical protein ACKO6N_27095 [Myxococcota bacterium]